MNNFKIFRFNFYTLLILFLVTFSSINVLAQDTLRFGVIGDYGTNTQPEADVANLIKSWNPDFITTVGDNNYPVGSASTIDENIGQFFHEYIGSYQGTYGQGADTNKFFPIPGHRDWDTDNMQPYLDYFTLPNNERYYDFIMGPVHFFMLDTDTREPDGTDTTSTQALWLKSGLESSSSVWNLVFAHHAPYTSHTVPDNYYMRWPFAAWGADALFSGFFHIYERLEVDNIPYFISGNGGSTVSNFGEIDPHSQFRYNGDYGAMLVVVDEDHIEFSEINRQGVLIDNYSINLVVPVEMTLFNASFIDGEIVLNWTTGTELNNSGFEIQRRYVNTEFRKIGFVGRNETTTSPISYSYIDKDFLVGNVYYRLKQFDLDGSYKFTNELMVEIPVLEKFLLLQNFPNPFNPETTISYFLANESKVNLRVYNTLGQQIAELENGEKEAGIHSVNFNSSNLPSGIYFYTLTGDDIKITKKMSLIK